jgi:hypothetical protein
MSWTDENASELEREAKRLCGVFKTRVGSEGWPMPSTERARRAVEEAWVLVASTCRGAVLFRDDAPQQLHALYTKMLNSWAIIPAWEHLSRSERGGWSEVFAEAQKIHSERQAASHELD